MSVRLARGAAITRAYRRRATERPVFQVSMADAGGRRSTYLNQGFLAKSTTRLSPTPRQRRAGIGEWFVALKIPSPIQRTQARRTQARPRLANSETSATPAAWPRRPTCSRQC